MTERDAPFTAAGRVVPAWLLQGGIAAACLLLLGGAVWMFAELAQKLTVVLVPVLLALLVAGVFEPVVARSPSRLPSWLVPLAVVLVILGVTIGGLLLIGDRLSEEVPKLGDDVQTGVSDLTQRFGIEVPSFLQSGSAGAGSSSSGGGSAGSGRAAEALKLGVEVLFGFFLTLALAFLFMKDGSSMWRWFLDRLSGRVRSRVDRSGRAAWATVGSYVRGLTVVAVFDAVATVVLLVVLGVPLVVTLAVLQLVGSYIPTFGALIAGAVAVLVAYVSGGLTTAVLTLVGIVVIQQIGNDVIEPWIMGRALRIHPIVVLVGVSAGAVLWNVAGALLFVPLIAAGTAAARALYADTAPSGSSDEATETG